MRYAALKNLTRLLPREKGEEAVVYLKEAIELDATECSLWWRLGRRHEDLGSYIEAYRAYEQALNLNAKHWPSLIGAIVSGYTLSLFELVVKLCFTGKFILFYHMTYVNLFISVKTGY